MEVEAQIIRNTEDISKVTAAVAELTVTMKYEMERSKEERDNVKSMVNELRGISDKLGSLTSLTAEMAELKSDVKVLQSLEVTCKEWRDKHDGAEAAIKTAVKAMWAVCGAGVLSVVGFVLYLFFTNATVSLMHPGSSSTHSYSHEVISGE